MCPNEAVEGSKPSSEFYYKPARGRHYAGGYCHGLKLLILGDSHHSGTWSEDAAKEVIDQYVGGENRPFLAKIQRMVAGSTACGEMERRAFWDRVAFTNLIQQPIGDASDMPSYAQWRHAWSCFPSIIRHNAGRHLCLHAKGLEYPGKIRD